MKGAFPSLHADGLAVGRGVFQLTGPLFTDRMEDDAVEGTGSPEGRPGDDDDAIAQRGKLAFLNEGVDVVDEIEHVLRRSHFVGDYAKMKGHFAQRPVIAGERNDGDGKPALGKNPGGGAGLA